MKFRLQFQVRWFRAFRYGLGNIRQNTNDRDPRMKDMQMICGEIETALSNAQKYC